MGCASSNPADHSQPAAAAAVRGTNVNQDSMRSTGTQTTDGGPLLAAATPFSLPRFKTSPHGGDEEKQPAQDHHQQSTTPQHASARYDDASPASAVQIAHHHEDVVPESPAPAVSPWQAGNGEPQTDAPLLGNLDTAVVIEDERDGEDTCGIAPNTDEAPCAPIVLPLQLRTGQAQASAASTLQPMWPAPCIELHDRATAAPLTEAAMNAHRRACAGELYNLRKSGGPAVRGQPRDWAELMEDWLASVVPPHGD